MSSHEAVESVDSVAWTEAVHYVTVDGHEVTHYGLDRSMTFYYRTRQGIYAKHGNGWVRICAPSQFL